VSWLCSCCRSCFTIANAPSYPCAAAHHNATTKKNVGRYLEAEDLEETFKFQQKDIKKAVAIDSARKSYSLQLDEFGPYTSAYSKSGRGLLLGGRKGHVALMDWSRGRLECELHLKETVRDVCFLHTENMFAVAQKKYCYIYDSAGVELHCLRKHIEVTKMEYLPYHFLLCTVGKSGYLKYQDTSTGNLICEHRHTHTPYTHTKPIPSLAASRLTPFPRWQDQAGHMRRDATESVQRCDGAGPHQRYRDDVDP